MAAKRKQTISYKGREPDNPFEVLLDKWQRNENVRWADLFTAWLKAPLAPRSQKVVLRVIQKIEWIG